jgi:hypothetical protein
MSYSHVDGFKARTFFFSSSPGVRTYGIQRAVRIALARAPNRKKIMCIIDAKRWVCSAFQIADTWMTNSSQPFLPTEAAASQSTSRSRASKPNHRA